MIAYACAPGAPSEHSAGWHWAVEASRCCELTVLTSAENRGAIERSPVAGEMRWEYFDLPHGAKGIRRRHAGFVAYYALWQVAVRTLVRRLVREHRATLVHHVTYTNPWLPTALPGLPVPTLLGPVGSGEVTASTVARALTAHDRRLEALRDAARALGTTAPWFRRLARDGNATFVATTAETAAWLSRRGAGRVRTYMPAVGLDRRDFDECRRLAVSTPVDRRFVSCGRLTHWKGFRFGLEAFARSRAREDGYRYSVIGLGAEERRLRRVAHALGIADRVDFAGRLSRADYLRSLAGATALVHPSFHDPGAHVVAEAMAIGRPVICVGSGGPGHLVGERSPFTVPPDESSLVEALADRLDLAAADGGPRDRTVADQVDRVERLALWERHGSWLADLYARTADGHERA